MYMLNTFAPSKAGWDVDDVDRDREGLPPLLNICAVNGNAEAVTLLIQNGADLSKYVLSDIVIESVRCPKKIKKLKTVYCAIVDNAVVWRCLEDDIKLNTKGSDEYNKFLRETMMWLITRPDKPSCNVIMHAIQCGASAMLQEILNTKHVFRFDGSEHREKGETRFDVTNFTLATRGDATPDPRPCSQSEKLKRDYSKQFDFQSYSSGMESLDAPKHDYEYSKCYLRELLRNRDKWRMSEILEMQPLRGLTTPYIHFVQKGYCLIGMLQLIYMILFSVYFIPTTCWLIEHFSLNVSSYNCESTAVHESSAKSFGPGPSWAWLLWPVMLCAENAIVISVDLYSKCLFRLYANFQQQIVTKLTLKFIGHRFSNIISVLFCIAVFFWYVDYGNTYYSYLKATSMVFLFGWIANFFFFSNMILKIYVFSQVLKEILVYDIFLGFQLVFAFMIVGFSFAIHVLRVAELPPDDEVFLGATVYDVFIAALGTGDYFQTAREERTEAGIYFQLFEVVVIIYLCVTAIILLNVLIAVMNYRYDKAELRAENFWRFYMLEFALNIELFSPFRRMFEKQLCLNKEELNFRRRCCYGKTERPQNDPEKGDFATCCCCGICCCYWRSEQLENDLDKPTRKLLKVDLQRRLTSIFRRIESLYENDYTK